MPDPARLLRTIERAIQAFRYMPGRAGRVLTLPEGCEVLATGDLHGNVENFRLLLEKADLGQQPERHLVFQELVHGPHRYPGGGDKSHQLLDLLAALKFQYPRQVHMLLGNHELAQWTGQWIGKEDEGDLNDVFRQGILTAYGSSAEAIISAYDRLFAAVAVAIRTPNRVFLCHSVPTASRLAAFDYARLQSDDSAEQDYLPGGMIHALVWGRDTRAATAKAFLECVDADWLVTGHIPCLEGFDTPNDRQLILDSQAAPAAYCLFPTDRPLTQEDLVKCVNIL